MFFIALFKKNTSFYNASTHAFVKPGTTGFPNCSYMKHLFLLNPIHLHLWYDEPQVLPFDTLKLKVILLVLQKGKRKRKTKRKNKKPSTLQTWRQKLQKTKAKMQKTGPQGHFYRFPNSLSSTFLLFLDWQIPQFSEGVMTKAVIVMLLLLQRKWTRFLLKKHTCNRSWKIRCHQTKSSHPTVKIKPLIQKHKTKK